MSSQSLTLKLINSKPSGKSLTFIYFYANKQTPYKMTHKGKTYYLSYNHQGSLKTITNTNQTIVKEIIYNPYGKILKDTNSSLQININYADGLYDKDTNLIRFGKRDYDPNTKRWTAKDPIDFSGGDFNLYRYVLNDPVNLINSTRLVDMNLISLDTYSNILPKKQNNLARRNFSHSLYCNLSL